MIGCPDHARRMTPSPLLLFLLAGTLACAQEGAETPSETAAVTVTEGYVTLPDGERVFYRRAGVGEQGVLLVPGLYLAPPFDAVAAGRSLIYIDPRNRGRSDPVEDSTMLTIEQEVRDLEHVRQHFGFEQVDLVGYSYAGLLVILYALEHPERVRRIVQLGPVPRRFGTTYPDSLTASTPPSVTAAIAALDTLPDDYPTTHAREYCELAWLATRARLVGDSSNIAALGPSKCDMPNEWPANLQRQFRFHFVSVQQLDVPEERVRALNLPVLTVHGTLDRNAFYGAGREWASTLPEARLLTVRGAGHQSWADAPDLVLDAVRTFLGGEWPAGAERLRPEG